MPDRSVSNTATHAVLRSFGPVLRPGGRLLVVAGSLGTLGHLGPRVRHLLEGASLDQVEYAVESWRTALHHNTAEEAGLATLAERALEGGSGRRRARGRPLDVVFAEHVDPTLYGELIRFGKALDWHVGTPPEEQDRMLAA
ncbi:hypothetical protein [Streptomyces sp. NPDC050355]|uniref:hypothetical protein n=1 Tax=Streptomyces sp. NPDC050355 TaxID=3365609 RepID=UPI0037947D18